MKLNELDMPQLSIGLPVFNGERYLKEVLDSILSQSFTDFELVISDNASTDQTEQIVRQYVLKDARVRYFRNPQNIGAPDNFNRVFELAVGKYFKWAAADDLYSPEYLKKCFSVIQNNPSIILCHSKTMSIDENGKIVGTYDREALPKASSVKPHERFSVFISTVNPCWDLFGIMLRENFRKTPLQGRYIGSDRNLLAEITLMGRIYEVPEYLYFGREHPDSYTSQFYSENSSITLKRYREQLAYWKANNWLVLPFAKNCLEYIRSINRVYLTISEKILCSYQILRWFVKEGVFHFAGDLKDFMLRSVNRK